MATLQEALLERLAETALTEPLPDGLAFVLLKQWPKRKGQGSTPEAFRDEETSVLKRVIILLPVDRVPHPGQQPGADGYRWDAFPLFQLFAEPHDNGKRALSEAQLLLEDLICFPQDGWEAITERGQRVSFIPAGGTPAIDSERFEGNMEATVRFRGTGARGR